MNFSKSGVDSYETEDFKDISYDFFIKEEKNDENKRIYLWLDFALKMVLRAKAKRIIKHNGGIYEKSR